MAECEQRLTEKLKVRDMEILCLQRRLEGVVAADGVVLGMAVASFDGNDHCALLQSCFL